MSLATPAANGQPPSGVAVRAPAPGEHWPWAKWLIQVVPIALTILLALISFTGRLASVETIVREVQHRMDRFESKMDRLYEQRHR